MEPFSLPTMTSRSKPNPKPTQVVVIRHLLSRGCGPMAPEASSNPEG